MVKCSITAKIGFFRYFFYYGLPSIALSDYRKVRPGDILRSSLVFLEIPAILELVFWAYLTVYLI